MKDETQKYGQFDPNSRTTSGQDWKQKHANDCDKAWKHEIVQDIIEEQVGNIMQNYGHLSEELVRYELSKIAIYTAQVARAQALGFDPNLLKLTVDEANEELWRKAQRIVELGTPVAVLSH